MITPSSSAICNYRPLLSGVLILTLTSAPGSAIKKSIYSCILFRRQVTYSQKQRTLNCTSIAQSKRQWGNIHQNTLKLILKYKAEQNDMF